MDVLDSQILKINNNILSSNIDCCLIIDEYEYNYYMEQKKEVINIEDKQRLFFFEN